MRRQRNKGKIRAGRYSGYSNVLSFLSILLAFGVPIFLIVIRVIMNCLSSPGEEMALVEHLKGMSLTAGAKHELKSLLISLVMLAKEDIARKLQRIGENFQLSQIAAVKLAEDAMSSDIIDEQAHSLDRYIQKVRKEVQHLDVLSWRSKVLISP